MEANKNLERKVLSPNLKIRSICFLALSIFFLTNVSKAQNHSIELWPEVDIWYRLTPAWRLSSVMPVTKYYESKTRDLNVFLQADYAWGHTNIHCICAYKIKIGFKVCAPG